jgi:uncharacterized MAPEG superfamily protein
MEEAVVPLNYELTYVVWSVVLLIVYIVAQAVTGAGELGLPYLAGARDENRSVKGATAGRLRRALANYLETWPAFAILAIVLTVTGRTDGLSATGAALWFWARVAYLPVYALGIPWLRTLVWAVSIVGLVLMLLAVLG